MAGNLDNKSAPDPAPDSWAAQPENEVGIWYMEMDADATWPMPPASQGTRRTLYFFEGEQVQVNGESIRVNHGILLDSQAAIQSLADDTLDVEGSPDLAEAIRRVLRAV